MTQAERTASTQALERRLLAHLSDGRERYSVELAELCGLSRRGISRVTGRLKVLEQRGLVTSRLLPALRTGLGRRYYKRASTQSEVAS
jgi:predicted transcriptional regulator